VKSPQQTAEQKNLATVVEKYANIVKQRHKSGTYGHQECPQCGYFQSWMLKSVRSGVAKNLSTVLAGVLVVLLAIFECRLALSARGDGGLSTVSFIFATISVLFILVGAAFLGRYVIHRFYEPNGNGPIPDKINEPNVVFQPSPADNSIAIGLQALSDQRTAEALTAFNSAIESDSGSSQAYMGRSQAYEAKGDTEQAVRDLRRYLAIAGSQADPKMLKHLDALQSKHVAAVPSSPDSHAKLPPKPATKDELVRFIGITVAAIISCFVLTQVFGFDRLILSLLVALVGGALLATAIDNLIVLKTDTRIDRQNLVGQFGLIALVVVFGMILDNVIVNWDSFADITSEVKVMCEASSSRSFISSVPDLGKVWVHGNLDANDLGREGAANLDEIDTLICVDESAKHVERCNYQGGGSFTRYERVWTVKVIDYASRNPIASNTFNGDSPANCPEALSSTGSSTEYGSDPSRSEVSDWLDTLETGD
jgi:tetratricopeptide (TPR) repeat protein